MRNHVPLNRLKRTIDLPAEGYVVIDTETTGLMPGKDEILSIAIVDPDGKELFYSLIRPLERRRWPKATEIHGITWKDVRDKPTIYDVGNQVVDILDNATFVAGYNTGFDMDMLQENGLPSTTTPTYDLMVEYAQAYGSWSDRKGDYLWKKLSECASNYGYRFEAHNALEDAKATAHCLKRFRDECEKELPAAEQREADLEKERKRAEEKRAEEEEQKRTNRRNRNIAIAVVVALLVGGGVLSFVFNPTLFWGVVFLILFFLWLISKLA